MSAYVTCECGWKSRPMSPSWAQNAARLHEKRHEPADRYTMVARDHVAMLLNEGATLQAIGKAVGVTGENIRLLHVGRVRHLRQHTAAALLALQPSDSLRHVRYRPPVTRTCPTCGAEFTVPAASKRKFCTLACSPGGRTVLHDREAALETLRAAAADVGTSPMRHTDYTAWRLVHRGPSVHWLFINLGGWNDALAAAGLPNQGPSRHYVNYVTTEDCWSWVRKAWADGVRSYAQYEAWQQRHDGAPCGSIVRRRIGWQAARLQLMSEAAA